MNTLTNEQLVKAREKMTSIVRGLSQVSKYEVVKEGEDLYSIKIELSAPLPDGVKLPSIVLGLPVHVLLSGEPVEKVQEIKPIEPVVPVEVSSMVSDEEMPSVEVKAVFGDGEVVEVGERRAARQRKTTQE